MGNAETAKSAEHAGQSHASLRHAAVFAFWTGVPVRSFSAWHEANHARVAHERARDQSRRTNASSALSALCDRLSVFTTDPVSAFRWTRAKSGERTLPATQDRKPHSIEAAMLPWPARRNPRCRW